MACYKTIFTILATLSLCYGYSKFHHYELKEDEFPGLREADEEGKVLAKCADGSCDFTNDVCGAEVAEIKHDFIVLKERRNLIDTIPKISKEWELSVDINVKDDGSYGQILDLVKGVIECYNCQDKLPSLYIWKGTLKVEYQSLKRVAYRSNGFYFLNPGAVIPEIGKFFNVKISQKKTKNGYKYGIYIDGKLQGFEKINWSPFEHRNVDILASYSDKVEMKNFVFKNKGAFDRCYPVCNKKLDNPDFVYTRKDDPYNYKESFPPSKGFLKDTLPVLTKEWQLDFEIMPLRPPTIDSRVNIMALVVYERKTLLSINLMSGRLISLKNDMQGVGDDGEYVYSPYSMPLQPNQFSKVTIKQEKISANDDYQYTVTINGELIGTYKITSPREYYNVKLYASDPFWNTVVANCEIKNIDFQNLAPIYPCPNMCKAKEEDVTIEGKKVKAVSYQLNQCRGLSFLYQLKVPDTIRTTEESCFSFYYKAKADYCLLRVFYDREMITYETVEKDVDWTKASKTVKTVIPYGAKDLYVAVRGEPTEECKEISLAGLELSEGACE